MKTRLSKLAVTAIMILFACISAYAQDVDGISLWDKCTKEQLIQRYGQPLSYEAQEGDSPEEGMIEVIKFRDVLFYLVNNQISGFTLFTNKSKAITKIIAGGVRIGDNASVLDSIKDKQYMTRQDKDGSISCFYCLNQDCNDTFSVCIKNSIITTIDADAK